MKKDKRSVALRLTVELSQTIKDHLDDLEMKGMFQPLGDTDYELSDCYVEDGLLCVVLSDAEKKKEIRLKPVGLIDSKKTNP